MPKRCVPCLHPGVKKALAKEFPAAVGILKQVPDCIDGTLIELCLNGKGRRRPNPRAQFIGQCIREEYRKAKRPVPQLMKECSLRWSHHNGQAANA